MGDGCLAAIDAIDPDGRGDRAGGDGDDALVCAANSHQQKSEGDVESAAHRGDLILKGWGSGSDGKYLTYLGVEGKNRVVLVECITGC